MLLIGERTAYLSHLPMFQDPEDCKIMPHRYQAIFEVTFDQQDKYVRDHQAPGAPKFYTLGPKLFLAHLIVTPPDFDQVLSVKVNGHEFTNEELAQGVVVASAGTTNTPAGRLKAKQQASGEMTSGSAPSLAKVQIEVSGELFFEEGELRVPAVFATTPEERKAGFP
jgi:hypothetical protein